MSMEVKSSLEKAAPSIKSHNQRAPDVLSVTSASIRMISCSIARISSSISSRGRGGLYTPLIQLL